MFRRDHPFFPYLILLVLSFIWGSSFILMKRGLEIFSPVQVGAYRLSIAGLALLPVVIRHWNPTLKPKLRYFLIVGLVGNGIPAFLFSTAQTKLNSSTAGALNALTPLFTLILGVFLFATKLTTSKVIGVLVGLAGALILILLKANGLAEPYWAYGLLIVLATLMYGTSVNTVGKYLKEVRPTVTAAVPLVLVAGPALVLLFTTDFMQRMHQPGAWIALGYISILGLIGSAASLVAFNKLIQMTSPIFASTTTYLMPIVALFWGLLDGEAMGWPQILGMLSILVGIWLVNRKRNVDSPKTI